MAGVKPKVAIAMKHKKQKEKLESDDLEQSRLFIEKAREVGADDGALRADELMRQLAKKPPEPKKRNKP